MAVFDKQFAVVPQSIPVFQGHSKASFSVFLEYHFSFNIII